ncbi:MAG: SGNH/GDSL hydrolase family protein [Clostridia bacterium]|nr:SGNH/GDSL hydrolase family protein [Clostridia bacterium]
MRRLSFGELQDLSAGALAFREEDGGLAFFKCTEEQMEEVARVFPNGMTSTRATTGVRLDFRTDSRRIAFAFTRGSALELLLDGVFIKRWSPAPRERTEIDLDTLDPRGSGKERRVTLVFGSHGENAVPAFLELEEGKSAVCQTYDRKFLFIGDSITQGWHSRLDVDSWAWRTTLFRNADSVIQGIGGDYFRPGAIRPLPFEPDAVFLALGTNDFSRFEDREEFSGRMRETMARLASLYPGKSVAAITPLPRFDGETRPAGDHAFFRGLIAAEAGKNGFLPVDGASLIPADASFFADAAHPNDEGFSLFAENLWRILLKDGRFTF